MLLFMDSVEHYATASITRKWTTKTLGSVAANGPGGRNALYDPLVTIGIGSTTTVIAGCRINPVLGNYNRITFNQLGGTTDGYVNVNSDGSVSVVTWAGGAYTTAGTSRPNVVRNASWSFLEFKMSVSATVAIAAVRVNGEEVLSLTGLNTSAVAVRIVEFRCNLGNMCDFYVCDTAGGVNDDFLGDVEVRAHFPTGAGSAADFTPSAGSNWQNVDDTAPDDATTNNSSNTLNHKDSFVFEDLKSAGGTIKGVQLVGCFSKDKSGAAQMKNRLEIGGSEYLGAAFYPSMGSYTYAIDIYDKSPATSAAFSEVEFNGMQIGYKRVA